MQPGYWAPYEVRHADMVNRLKGELEKKAAASKIGREKAEEYQAQNGNLAAHLIAYSPGTDAGWRPE